MKICGALVLLMVSGCATSGVTSGATLRREFLRFDADESSATRWHDIETDTFKLTTDLPADQARQGAQLIAQSLVAVSAMFGRAPVINAGKIEIIAFASDMEFERVFGTRIAGITFSGPEGSTLFVYGSPAKWFERQRVDVQGTNSVVQHELAHAVLRRYFPKQPRWFAEGMADFLETAEWYDDDNVRIGELNVQAYISYSKFRAVSVHDMLHWSGFGEREGTTHGLYGLSWMFIHWAFDAQLPMLGKYFFLLSKGDPEAAWAQTFGPLTDSLDSTLHQYAKVGAYTRPLSKVAAREPIATRFAATPEKDAADLEAFIKTGVKLQ